MNRTAPLLITVVLCAVWQPYCAASDNRCKLCRQAAARREQIADGSEEKWEHDPVAFTVHDRNTILSYYHGMTVNFSRPANGRLSKLGRDDVLPIDLQKRLESLSGEIERQLQPLYSGYTRGIIGRDVVILEIRTHRIMDIIHDVTGRH